MIVSNFIWIVFTIYLGCLNIFEAFFLNRQIVKKPEKIQKFKKLEFGKELKKYESSWNHPVNESIVMLVTFIYFFVFDIEILQTAKTALYSNNPARTVIKNS